MSTRNISEEVEAARRHLGQLASAARSRVTEIDRDRDGLDRERNNVMQGARLALQGISDEEQELLEERGQLAGALSGTSPAEEPAEDEPSEEPSNEGGSDETETGDTDSDNSVPRPRFYVADSWLGVTLAVLAGLLTMYLLWSFATSGWVLAFPAILLGLVKTIIAAVVVFIVAYAAGHFGDALEPRVRERMQR